MPQETEGATAPLRNSMLTIMAQGRLKVSHLLPAESKGPYGLTEAEATSLLGVYTVPVTDAQASAELAHEIDTALDAALRQRGLTSANERDILASHIKRSLDTRGFQITRKDS